MVIAQSWPWDSKIEGLFFKKKEKKKKEEHASNCFSVSFILSSFPFNLAFDSQAIFQ